MSSSAPHCDIHDLARFRPWLTLLARLELGRGLEPKLDASDIAQQTLLEACRDVASFRGSTEAELGAWLRQILAHVVGHEIRKYRGTQMRDVAQERSLERSLDASSQRLAGLLADRGPSPSQQAMGKEHALILAEVLERLPPDYRDIIILRNLEGLSHEEAAERLGRSAGAARMLWVRALGRLRQELGPWPGA